MCNEPPKEHFEQEYLPGSYDSCGHYKGSTEIRNLLITGGRLFAGNGYWMDTPGNEGWQGAQILVKNSATAAWEVEHQCATAQNAVSALYSANFPTVGVWLVMASTWGGAGKTYVLTRQPSTRAWSSHVLTDSGDPSDGSQIRSFGVHTDSVTKADMVFAGQSPNGIYAGVYDASNKPGLVTWGKEPELVTGADEKRVMSFVQYGGKLYATIAQQIFERIDGAKPKWQVVYTNPKPGGSSESGLRGMIVYNDQLWVAVEGSAARIMAVDPKTWTDQTLYDIIATGGAHFGCPLGYSIAAYSSMNWVTRSDGYRGLLIGMEATLKSGAKPPPGLATDKNEVGTLSIADAQYLVYRPTGKTWTLKQLPAITPKPTIAVRAILHSPFNAKDVYFAGIDCNKNPCHNTAYILRSTIDEVTDDGQSSLELAEGFSRDERGR